MMDDDDDDDDYNNTKLLQSCDIRRRNATKF